MNKHSPPITFPELRATQTAGYEIGSQPKSPSLLRMADTLPQSRAEENGSGVEKEINGNTNRYCSKALVGYELNSCTTLFRGISVYCSETVRFCSPDPKK